MKSYGTLVGELPTGIEFVVEGALLRIYFDFERREAVQKAGSEDVVVEDQYVCENVDVEGEHDYDSIVSVWYVNATGRTAALRPKHSGSSISQRTVATAKS